MIFPRNFEEKIGFERIRGMLKDLCVSPMGAAYVDKIRFSANSGSINKLLDQTEEFRQMLLSAGNFPSSDYLDLTPELKRIAIEGTFIEQDRLFDLRSSLAAVSACILFISKHDRTEFPELHALTGEVFVEPGIIIKADRIIDRTGNIRDDASPGLAMIRKKLGSKRLSIDRQINSALKQAKQSGWVMNDAEITIRNGRPVIPVTATHKRQIRGFIHDQSATGQTVYIEPEAVFEINNEIREIEAEERREIIYILTEFTDYLRPLAPDLLDAYRFLGMIDFISAKAKFAIRIKAVKPLIGTSPQIQWTDAVHPLLFLSHQKQSREVVPLDVSLDDQNRILVISGPNAGGKSVCLKTIGLLQYMLQCGLLISVRQDSCSGIFSDMYIDIGDEQSLENDLSTYSSHLTSMKYFVLNTNSTSLFLIDELGTGTEPHLGGAIAQSILEKLNEKKSFGVVTTHYSNLKLMARRENGIINGAMLFDAKAMQPLFKLSIGKPGGSYALEIARKIGFPKSILRLAEKLIGKKQLDFDDLLQQLETERKILEKDRQKISEADSRLKTMTEKYSAMTESLEKQKSEILAKAKEEAAELIESSNKLIEKTIKEIRESQAEKEKTKSLRATLKLKEKKIHQIKTGEPASRKKSQNLSKTQSGTAGSADTNLAAETISTGDYVRFPEQDVVGEVIDVIDDEAIIALNSIRFKTQLSRLEKVGKQLRTGSKISSGSSHRSVFNDLNDKLAKFNLQLDVRGKRGEEAIDLVTHYIDDAVLLNVREVRILHGKGFGILRTLIHDYLRTIPEVREFHDEHIERGGHGITVVILK
jgi:DNA mismatch repair protein MutS2